MINKTIIRRKKESFEFCILSAELVALFQLKTQNSLHRRSDLALRPRHFDALSEAFLADLRFGAGEQPFFHVLRGTAKTAMPGVRSIATKEPPIPRHFDRRRFATQFAVVSEHLHANLDALIADVTGTPLKEPRHFPFTQSAER